MLIGTVIVIGAGIFIIWREHKWGWSGRCPQAPDAAGVRLLLIRPAGTFPARGEKGYAAPSVALKTVRSPQSSPLRRAGEG